MTPENREREEFEKWYAAEYLMPPGAFRTIEGTYEKGFVKDAWEAWQAARASQQAGPQSLPVEAISEDADYFRICALEAQLRSAVSVLRSVKECRPQFMPNVVSGEIADIEKLLPKSPDQAQPEEKA